MLGLISRDFWILSFNLLVSCFIVRRGVTHTEYCAFQSFIFIEIKLLFAYTKNYISYEIELETKSFISIVTE